MSAAQPYTGTLTVRANGDANSYALLDDHGQWLLAVLHNGQALEAKQLATLNRLAACWNACQGIPTAQLELAASWGDIIKAAVVSVPPHTGDATCTTR
ncbi:hypothetical protein [Acidovorax sp. BL-A-41-H1]|uniref:hypothetical protein n=1 Tax=Acidovorax sp. BL-A-41-H1 TaxID=3421102 RepID=UPI003F7A098E